MNFIDLETQQNRIKSELDLKIATVLAHGSYILGPEVKALEAELATFCDAEFSVSCANGTDALILSMRAMGIKAGDAVFCPSFTYCATAESIASIGAHPVFVDIDRATYNMCPESLERSIKQISDAGTYTPKAVIIVDLFGQCANYPELLPIARKANLKVISDAAQGFGSTFNSHHPIHWADTMTTSFFPAKPLGCYGDGGAIFTNDENIARLLESYRFHGRDFNVAHNHLHIGMNSRLDSLQAAVLQCKLKIFPDEIKARNKIAKRYTEAFNLTGITSPTILDNVISIWAQYTIEVQDADGLSQHLKAQNIPSARYYPLPTHLQTAYKNFTCDQEGLNNTEDCMSHVISLPIHAYLETKAQDKIINAVTDYIQNRA